MPVSDFDPVFEAAGREWNVDPNLLRAMAAQESSGDPRAVSKAGAQGLMQIMPATQRYLGVTDPMDPTQSIYGGAKYMSEALDAEKSPQAALAYYHGGAGWRDAYGPESASYVPGVTKHYQRLTQGGTQAVPAQATKAPAAADDPFTAALNAQAPASPPAAASDPFTQALNAPDAAVAEPAAVTAAPDGPSANGLAVPDGMPSLAGNLPSDTPGTPGPTGSIDRATVGNALAIPPGRYNGTFLPWTADEGTGANGNISLPGFIRQPLQGLVGGIGNALTFNPQTNAYGLSPEAQSVALAGANPLRFGTPSAPISLLGQPERDLRAAPLSADFRANPLAQPIADMPGMTVRPGEAPAGISPGMGGPAPNAAGAQASTTAQAEMSPATIKANRRQAEVAEVNAPAGPTDETFVEGSHLTLAQRAANPTTSQHETMLSQRNPDAFTGDAGVYGRQNAARVDKYRSLTPSDTQIDNWRTEQKALAQTDKAAVMTNAQPADLEPAVAHLDGLMSDKRLQESPEIMATLAKLKETLYDKGNLKTDPESVWGMHDNIKNMIEKSKDKTSVERFAQSQLIEFKNIIDGVMNKATGDRFQVFLDHWADYAKRINAGELLGKFEALRLTNAKGQLQANTFHKFVRDLAYSRGKRGLDPSMDIPDAVMQNLIAIDKDLKQAGLIDLGAARGSPTNLFGVLAKDMGIGVAHMGLVAADMAHGGMGNILLQGAIKRGGEAFNILRMRSLTRKHLAEPKGGWRPVAEQYRTPDWNALDPP